MIDSLARDYDYILIDLPPVFDNLTHCGLYAADGVLIPVDYGRKSLQHASIVHREIIPRIRKERINRAVSLPLAPWSLGIVFSNCPTEKGSRMKDLINSALDEYGFKGIKDETELRSYAQLKSAEFQNKPVACWHKSPISILYRQLTDEIFWNHNFIND